MDQYSFKLGSTVITGAAGGIGRSVAMLCASYGSDLALIDRDSDGLSALVLELSNKYPDQTFTSHVLDLSRIDKISAVVDNITKSHNKVGLLINNAGIAMSGTFEELSLDNIDLVMTINFRAQVALIKYLLPNLKKIKGSHIANVSSLFGLVSPAKQSAYSASKFAVRGFSDVIRGELEQYSIGVTTIYPAGVKTNIAKNSVVGDNANAKKAQKESAKFDEKFLKMTPEKAAEIIVKGIIKRKPRVLVGSTAVILDILARLLPGSYIKYINRGM